MSFGLISEGQANVPIISDEEYKSLSPEERQKYETRLKQQIESMSPAEQEAYMQGVVEQMFESLTPEQQKEVLDEAARIEQMSEKERQEYFKKVEQEIEEAFGTPGKAQPQEPEPEEPMPEPKSEPQPELEEKELPVKVKTSKKEKAIKEALSLINEIRDGIDNLMVKIEAKEDFIAKLTVWGKKKKIKSWDGGFEWEKLKNQISIFRGQLDKLKDRDPKTKKHKYLPHLLQNEELYNQLYNTSIDLVDYESSVRVAKDKPLTKKIRKKSNKALRSLIDMFVGILFSDDSEKNLIKALNDLFVKFDPEAEKIRDEEKKLAEEALEKSKRKGRSSRTIVAGQGDEPDFMGFSDEYEDYDPGYRDTDWSDYSPDYPSSYYDETERGDDRFPGETKPTDKTTPKKDKPTTKPKKEEVFVKDRRFKNLHKALESSLEGIADTVDEHPRIKKLKPYFVENTVDKGLVKAFSSLKKFLQRATRKLEAMQSRIKDLKNETTKKAYKKEVKSSIGEYKKDIEDIVNSLQAIKSDNTLLQTLNNEMKWAHFKEWPPPTGQPIPAPLGQLKTAIPEPTTIDELLDVAQKYLEEAKKTTKK